MTISRRGDWEAGLVELAAVLFPAEDSSVFSRKGVVDESIGKGELPTYGNCAPDADLTIKRLRQRRNQAGGSAST